MEKSASQKLISRRGILIDLILSAGFFVYMLLVLKKHVPWTEAPAIWQWAGAAYAALCLSILFWMAACLFRVTLIDQLRRRKENKIA